jgi:hypothetical protein
MTSGQLEKSDSQVPWTREHRGAVKIPRRVNRPCTGLQLTGPVCPLRWHRSISRIKHDLHRRKAQSAHSPAGEAGAVWQPRPAAPPGQTRTCAHDRAHTEVIRAWEPRHRSVEVAVLIFRVWHVCARLGCHRNKPNLHATLRSASGSELVSLSDRILLLVACRPRTRVVCACAVGVARRGTQIGGLGAPCKL